MKLWHFAALLALLGIAYVLIKRPTVVNQPVSTSASNAQGLLNLGTSLANLGASIFSGSNKAAPPSAIPPTSGPTITDSTPVFTNVGSDVQIQPGSED